MSDSNKYSLNVENHPLTKNHPPEFYRKFMEDNGKPYVRQVPKGNGGNHKKIHNESVVFGLVCVHPACNNGDVHRHHDSEVRYSTAMPVRVNA